MQYHHYRLPCALDDSSAKEHTPPMQNQSSTRVRNLATSHAIRIFSCMCPRRKGFPDSSYAFRSIGKCVVRDVSVVSTFAWRGDRNVSNEVSRASHTSSARGDATPRLAEVICLPFSNDRVTRKVNTQRECRCSHSWPPDKRILETH